MGRRKCVIDAIKKLPRRVTSGERCGREASTLHGQEGLRDQATVDGVHRETECLQRSCAKQVAIPRFGDDQRHDGLAPVEPYNRSRSIALYRSPVRNQERTTAQARYVQSLDDLARHPTESCAGVNPQLYVCCPSWGAQSLLGLRTDPYLSTPNCTPTR